MDTGEAPCNCALGRGRSPASSQPSLPQEIVTLLRDSLCPLGVGCPIFCPEVRRGKMKWAAWKAISPSHIFALPASACIQHLSNANT